MAEYIELEVAVKAFNNFDAGRADSPSFTLLRPEEFAEYLYELPTANVAPVVNGRWEHLGGDEWCCSACGFVITTEGSWDKPTKKYCEDCGAMMDGGDSDAAD